MRCVFCTVPLWFLSSGRSRNFGISGSEYKHCVYPKSALLAGLGPKDNSWEELACESPCSGTLSSTRFSFFLQSFRYVGKIRVSPYLFVILIFIWFWDFGWLGKRVSPFFPFNMFTWHSYGIGIYPTQVSPCLSHSGTCHGWWNRRAWGRRGMINFLPLGVMDVEEGKLEEELVDKPGTTSETKFSMLHCIRIPFLMRCGFWPLIHSYEHPCSSQSFPSDRTAGVSSRTFIVKNIPKSLT